MINYTDDPIADAEMHMAELDKKLANLPLCNCCFEPIDQEKAIYYENQWVCRDCERDFWEDIRGDFLVDVES